MKEVKLGLKFWWRFIVRFSGCDIQIYNYSHHIVFVPRESSLDLNLFSIKHMRF